MEEEIKMNSQNEESEPVQENFAELLANHEAHADKLRPGQKVKGKIIAISGDDVFVDVGLKQDGVMDRKEILDNEGKETAGIGGEVEAFVIGISSQGIKLSRAMGGSGVEALEEAKDAGLPVEGRVKNTCKGGFQVEVLGKTAFCPGSQMEIMPGGQPEEPVGKQMRFLITRIENHGRNIVVSRRALIERERSESLDKLLESLKTGDVVEARIVRLAPFGAFAELAPMVEGMIHLSELSWSRVNSADEAVSVGDVTPVKVLGINHDDKGRVRISLSRKQAIGDPWEEVSSQFHSGDIVEGKVVRLAPFGAFVEIAPGVDGLVHLSEMSWEKRINKAEDALEPGERVQVKIKEISPDTRRISLSLRDAQGDPWATVEEQFSPGSKVSGMVESKSPHGVFVTLAPGVSGLLPASTIKNAPNSSELAKLASGDKVELVVQKVDTKARRISLAPLNAVNAEEEDKSWREHTKSRPTPSTESSNGGLMAQALQKAFKKKEQGEKKA